MRKNSFPVAGSQSKLPRSIFFIVGNEFAERLSFFGMRSILSIFLVNQFFNPHGIASLTVEANARSNAYTHAFSTIVYFTPLLGGILADWFWGKYRVILLGSIIYTFGHLLLALFNDTLPGFTAGLIIIALAAGAIKSCVVANVGDQFNHNNSQLMSRGYSWFYFSINAGSMVSVILIPIILDKYGAGWAFGVPGIMMALAAIIFYTGRKLYVKVPAKGIKKDNFLRINLYVLSKSATKRNGKTAWQMAEEKFSIQKIEDVKAVWRVVAIFAFIPIFWGMYDMSQSEWTLQATKLDLNLGIFGIKALPSQITSANALLLLLLLPLFNYGIYPLVEKIGIKVTALRKIGAGLFVTALSFVIIALLEAKIQMGFHPSVWWQFLAYILLTGSEVMVVVTGLEYAYTQSPPSMKSTMTAIWFFTYSIGTSFTTYVNVSIANHGFFRDFTGARYYWLFVWIMLCVLIVFAIVSSFIQEKNYLAEKLPL